MYFTFFSRTMAPVYLDNIPAGSSTRPFVHYAQFHDYNYEFKKYDFGCKSENMKHYGTPKPPNYDLKNVEAPVYLWAGGKDILADTEDVTHLSKILTQVLGFEHLPTYNHFDFATAIDVDKLVYSKILENMLAFDYDSKQQIKIEIV